MKWFILASASVMVCSLSIRAGEQPAPDVFTASQAETGRIAATGMCGMCHTPALTGRVGNSDENPPVSSLNADFQKFVGNSIHNGKVPALIGSTFMSHWEAKTTADLATAIRGTMGTFFPERKNDDQTALAITAYILQLNGAKPGSQELTMASSVGIRSLVNRN